MLKVCLVKQHTCYDLYKVSGKNLRTLVDSSNWRSGPIGLWEAFDCEFRVVDAHADRECKIGEKYWKQYVEDWDIWPKGYSADSSNEIDWSQFNIVISIDVTIPARIIRQYPDVMWCYYFIEGGPRGIDSFFKGSPFYSYNVFLNHRFAKSRLTQKSDLCLRMQRTRRAVLDFPYYMQSSKSIQALYPEFHGKLRQCITLAHHSYSLLTQEQRSALSNFGEILDDYKTISDIHRLELRSRYYIMHPEGPAKAGLGMIEAISAGCLALSPSHLLWGFPELVHGSLEYRDFNELIILLETLEKNHLYHQSRIRQAEMIDRWCYRYPAHNLYEIYKSFKASSCSARKQNLHEKASFLFTQPHRMKTIIRYQLKNTVRKGQRHG